MPSPYILLSNALKVDAAKPLDYLYGPWASVAEALSKIASNKRFVGLTCAVLVEGHAVEYWFKNGINDSDLIAKQSGGGGGGGLTWMEIESLGGDPTTTLLEPYYSNYGANAVVDLSTEFLYLRYGEEKWLKIVAGILGPGYSPNANVAGVNYLSMV